MTTKTKTICGYCMSDNIIMIGKNLHLNKKNERYYLCNECKKVSNGIISKD